MTSLLKYPKAPQCFSCLRSAFLPDLPQSYTPFRSQLRGKKRIRLPPTINVKLLRDIYGYGQEGAIVPVAPGRMRNIWYPGKRAEYVTTAQLRDMGDVVVERDFEFGMEQELTAQEPVQREKIFVETKPLHPERATKLLDSSLPLYLDFYRSRITTPEPEPPRSAPKKRTAASQAAADLAAAYAPDPKPKPALIYGSVSTTDVATSIKTLLMMRVADNPDIGRIVLNSEDIRLVQDEGEIDDHERIKTLGEFNVEITVEGGQPIKRIVRVVAQQ